jgi:hypothetical protein
MVYLTTLLAEGYSLGRGLGARVFIHQTSLEFAFRDDFIVHERLAAHYGDFTFKFEGDELE